MLRHKHNVHRDTDESGDEIDTELSEEEDFEEENSEEEEVDSDSEDPWDELVTKAFEQCELKFSDYVKSYMNKEGATEHEARKQVYRHMQSKYRKALAKVLTDKVLWFNHLSRDPLFRGIKKTVSRIRAEQDMDEEESWRYGINQRMFALDSILNQYLPPEVSDSEEESQQPNRALSPITVVSPAQGDADRARSELERPYKKRKHEDW